MGYFFTLLLKSAVLTSIPRQTVSGTYGMGPIYLPSWSAMLCTVCCSSVVPVQPWGSLQRNQSLILLHQGRSLIKPLKRRTKKYALFFSSMLVTTALLKSVRKEVKKAGRHALSHQQLSAAPRIFWNVLWWVNTALGVSRISRAILIISQGISLSF